MLFVLGMYSCAKGLRKFAWRRMILKVFGRLRYMEPQASCVGRNRIEDTPTVARYCAIHPSPSTVPEYQFRSLG